MYVIVMACYQYQYQSTRVFLTARQAQGYFGDNLCS